MKPLIYLISLVASFLLIPLDVPAAGTVHDYRFFSKALHREMAGRMYLPEDYNPNSPQNRFPVVYFLHGATEGYTAYGPIFTAVDYLISLNLIKPVILVLPDGLAPPYMGSFYTNSALYGNYEDYITYDLISYIDTAFYTINERGKRAIMGTSMGGYGALKIAIKHQDLFIGVAGHSAPANITMMDIYIPDLVREDGGAAPFHWSPGPEKALTNLTFTMAGAFSPNLSNPYQVDFPLDSLAKPVPEVMERWKYENICEIARIYHPGTNLGITFDCGNADEYYLNLQNRSLADTLTKYNIPYTYEEYTGNHVSGLPARVILSFTYFNHLFQSSGAGIPLMPSGLNSQSRKIPLSRQGNQH